MCSKKYLIFLFSVLCVLQLSSSVAVVPSQQLPTELFKPIKANSGATNTGSSEQVVDNTRSGGSHTNHAPQSSNTGQQIFSRPKTRVPQGFNIPEFRQDQVFDTHEFRPNQGFHRPNIIRQNNLIAPGHPQQFLNNPDVNQNGYVQRTYTVQSTEDQPSYTVTSYQSPTYHRTYSWSSDGDRTENFSVDGPQNGPIPNGFGINDISFDDNFGEGFNGSPFGGSSTITRSGYHTVRTTGPDGRVREKTTYW